MPYHLRKEEKIMNIRYIKSKGSRGLKKAQRRQLMANNKDTETRRYGDTVTRRHGEKGSYEVRKLGRWEN